MTSYQRQKQQIEYWKQVAKNMHHIATELEKQMKQAGIPPKPIIDLGLKGSDFIMPWEGRLNLSSVVPRMSFE